MLWWKKRTDETVEAGITELMEPARYIENPSLEQMDKIFENVVWARDQISSMLDALIEHQADDHECSVFCIPESIVEFLSRVPREGLLVLLSVALKDAVVWEEVDNAEGEGIS